MSLNSLFVKHGFIKNNAPLTNSLGRFIPQLMRITLKFCKESPGSHGVREFIEKEIVKYAQTNPHVAIYLKPRRQRSPVIVAEYLNGERHWQSMYKKSPSDVSEWLDLYRNSSGKEYQSQRKYEFTQHPSIQGMWNSYVNVDPEIATAKFPDANLSKPYGTPMTTTEYLQRMHESQKSSESLPKHENELLESTKQS